MKTFLSNIVRHNFPHHHVKYALGYGSAVFHQDNYQIDDVCNNAATLTLSSIERAGD
jgi:hypothetical protein